MGIELSIRITSPLEAEDRELLSGIAVMTLAIANHEMAKQAFPDTFGDDEDERAGTATHPAAVRPCGVVAQDGTICVSHMGHRGRHRFRDSGLPN